MNKIKSIFIGVYPMLAMGISSYGVYALLTEDIDYIWLGAILINLPIVLFISRVMIFKDMARTSPHFPLITLTSVVGVILTGYVGVKTGFSNLDASERLGFILSLTSFCLYLLYNFWYSSLGRDAHELLKPSNLLPSFTLTDISGRAVDSDTFIGAPTIFIFFRGNWCPLCMAQIKEVARNYRELSRFGALVALISPQPEEHTQVLAAKFDVPLKFFTDSGGEAAKTLGLEMKNGLPAGMEIFGYSKDTIYPTVIITNNRGKIIYSDFTNNYRVRPEPKEFIRILSGI